MHRGQRDVLVAASVTRDEVNTEQLVVVRRGVTVVGTRNGIAVRRLVAGQSSGRALLERDRPGGCVMGDVVQELVIRAHGVLRRDRTAGLPSTSASSLVPGRPSVPLPTTICGIH